MSKLTLLLFVNSRPFFNKTVKANYSRRKHFYHSTSVLFNRVSTKRVVVLREIKGFREGTAKVLCLLLVFISCFSILISYM